MKYKVIIISAFLTLITGCGGGDGSPIQDSQVNQEIGDSKTKDDQEVDDSETQDNPPNQWVEDSNTQDNSPSQEVDKSELQDNQSNQESDNSKTKDDKSNQEVGDSITLTSLIDDSLEPNQQNLAPFDDGIPRPVAASKYNNHKNADFVSNELLLTTNDKKQLDTFLNRWNGKILLTIPPLGDKLKPMVRYLVRIDTSLADTELFTSLLKNISPKTDGTLSVSNQQGIELITAAAIAQKAGFKVDINWVMKPDTFNDRISTEGESKNAFKFSYMKTGGAQNIGITDAWIALERAGKLDNKVTVAVIDGGFAPNNDFPTNHQNLGAPLNTPSYSPCRGGNPCPWHGTGAANAISGLANNNYGGAGSAGPIANLITYQVNFDLASNIDAIGKLKAKADIISMSFGFEIPGWLANWTLDDISDYIAEAYNQNGIMFFASAGNSNINIDAGERKFHNDPSVKVPCELRGVTCIGALANNSSNKISYSNYGGDIDFKGGGYGSVDYFAPTNIWVGGDPQKTTTHAFGGTSAATPFAAGIAALVKAADPSLSAMEVDSILYTTANTGSSDSKVDRWFNAKAAVLAALKSDSPPVITIDIATRHLNTHESWQPMPFKATIDDIDTDVSEYQIHWTYKDHNETERGLAITKSGEVATVVLCDGNYQITAAAHKGDGSGVEASKVLLITQPTDINGIPPKCDWNINIVQPSTNVTYTANQPIHLKAAIQDDHPESDQPLLPIIWRLASNDIEIGRGLEATTTLPVGNHKIYAQYGHKKDNVFVNVLQHSGHAPVAKIISPLNNSFYAWTHHMGGDNNEEILIPLKASATDQEDGVLSNDSEFKWSFYDDEFDQWVDLATGKNVVGGFPLEYIPVNNRGNITIRLIVTDSDSIQDIKTVEIELAGYPG